MGGMGGGFGRSSPCLPLLGQPGAALFFVCRCSLGLGGVAPSGGGVGGEGFVGPSGWQWEVGARQGLVAAALPLLLAVLVLFCLRVPQAELDGVQVVGGGGG